MKRLSLRRFVPSAVAVHEAVTKFGGQPSWLGPPAWPLSASSGEPLRFICQIELRAELFGDGPARMAYLFLNQPPRDAIEEGAFDPDVMEADGGENAVILQPSGAACLVETRPLPSGPSLYDQAGEPCEHLCELEAAVDPPYLSREQWQKLTKAEGARYIEKLEGTKLGGTPDFELEEAGFPRGKWQLALQLDQYRRPGDPLYLNLGSTLARGFLLLSADRTEGRFVAL